MNQTMSNEPQLDDNTIAFILYSHKDIHPTLVDDCSLC